MCEQPGADAASVAMRHWPASGGSILGHGAAAVCCLVAVCVQQHGAKQQLLQQEQQVPCGGAATGGTDAQSCCLPGAHAACGPHARGIRPVLHAGQREPRAR